MSENIYSTLNKPQTKNRGMIFKNSEINVENSGNKISFIITVFKKGCIQYLFLFLFCESNIEIQTSFDESEQFIMIGCSLTEKQLPKDYV